MSYPPPPGNPEGTPEGNETPGQPAYPQQPYGQPPYGQPPYGQQGWGPAGGYSAAPASSQKALWALITGILGIVCCGVASIAAIILGNQAKQEIAASNGMQTGEGQAQAGFILGIVGLVIWVLGIVAWVALVALAGTDSTY